MKRYNVVPGGRGDANSPWLLKVNGRLAPDGRFRKQRNAIKEARKRASPGDQISIHNHDGKVRDSSIVRGA